MNSLLTRMAVLFGIILSSASAQAQNWSTVNHDATINRSINDLFFINGTGYAAGWRADGVPWGTRGLLYKSTDGGQTWNAMMIPLLIGSDSVMAINAIHCNGISLIYAAASCYTTNGSAGIYYGAVIRSTDGGNTWTSIRSEKNQVNYSTGHTFHYNDIYFTDAQNGFVAADEFVTNSVSNAYMVTTYNAGASWSSYSATNGTSGLSTHFTSSSTGLMTCGRNMGFSGPNNNGRICRTTNWGGSWNTVFTDNNYSYVDVHFPSVNTGFAVADSVYNTFPGSAYGKVVKTTDNGITWTPMAVFPNFMPSCVWFIDTYTGYIGGQCANNNSGIYKTTDGGQTWAPMVHPDQTGFGGVNITSIKFSTPQTGFASNTFTSSNSIYSGFTQNCGVSAGPDIVSCQQPAALAAMPAFPGTYNYSWTPANLLSTGSFSQTVVTNNSTLYNQAFVVTLTDPNSGCTATDTVLVTTAQMISPMTQYLCPGDTLTLDFGPGATNYFWQYFTDTSNVQTFLNINTQTLAATQPGQYLGYALFPQCGAITSLVTVVDSCITPICAVDAGRDTALCGYMPWYYQLNASPASPGNYTYSWSPATGLSNAGIQNPHVNNVIGQTYTVTMTDGTCTATDTVRISSVNVIFDTSYVCSQINGTAALALLPGAFNYSWSGPSGNLFGPNYSSITASQAGQYIGIGFYNLVTTSCACTNVFTVIDSCNVAVPNVWPGDCNYDLQANMADALQIGLGYNTSGAVRPSATNGWYAQPMTDWAQNFVSCNYKHADANGDGIINVNDTLPISLNYGLTHPFRTAPPQNIATNPTLILVPSYDTVGLQTLVNVDIRFGDNAIPVDSLYGLSFRINMDANLIDTTLTAMDYSGSWLGTVGNNMISFTKPFRSQGVIDAAEVRTNHVDQLNGNGTVASFSIVTTDNLSGIAILHLALSDVRAITTSEIPLHLNIVNDSIVIDPSVPAGILTTQANNNHIDVYPNPARDLITVNTAAQQQLIRVTDLTGREVLRQAAASGTTRVSVSSLAEGVYILSVKTDAGESTQRITVTR